MATEADDDLLLEQMHLHVKAYQLMGTKNCGNGVSFGLHISIAKCNEVALIADM